MFLCEQTDRFLTQLNEFAGENGMSAGPLRSLMKSVLLLPHGKGFSQCPHPQRHQTERQIQSLKWSCVCLQRSRQKRLIVLFCLFLYLGALKKNLTAEQVKEDLLNLGMGYFLIM